MPPLFTDNGTSNGNGAGHRLIDPKTGKPFPDRRSQFALPNVLTHTGVFQGAYHTFLHEAWDAALKHHREDAVAMWNDCWLQSLLNERLDGTLELKWHVEAEDQKDPTQAKCAAHLTKAIKRTPYLRRFRRMLMNRVWYGRYANQVVWKWEGIDGIKSLVVDQWSPVNGDKLGWQWYDEEKQLYTDTPYVLVTSGGMVRGGGEDYGKHELITTDKGYGLLLRGTWRNRFIIGTHLPDDSDFFHGDEAGKIHGVGLRNFVYWSWWMKTEGWSWIWDQLERLGLGLLICYFEQGNKDSETAADNVMRDYSRRAIIKMPRPPGTSGRQVNGSTGLEIVETPTGAFEVVERLKEDLETKIERYMVGQGMSDGSDDKGSLGGTGKAKFAQATKRSLIVGDAEDEAEILTGSDRDPGLLSMMFRWTFPQYFNKFNLRIVHDIDEQDPGEKLEAVSKAVSFGVTFKEDEVRSLTGLSKPEADDKVVGGQQAMGQPGGAPGGAPGQPQPGAQQPGAETDSFMSYLETLGASGDRQPDETAPAQYAFDEQSHPRGQPGNAGQFTSGPASGATADEVDESHKRLTNKMSELSGGENVSLKGRQYLGQVKDFFPGHERLHPKVAGTHVFFDPEADEDENGAASVNLKRYADGRPATAPTVRIGPRGLKGEGSSGSLGDTFAHEIEHLVDFHAGKQATEFTPRFRQMMRGLEAEPNVVQFLGKNGKDGAEYYVDNYFDQHPGHGLTPEERNEAADAVAAQALAIWKRRAGYSRDSRLAHYAAPWDEQQHPRGQPENAGEFGPGGGGAGKSGGQAGSQPQAAPQAQQQQPTPQAQPTSTAADASKIIEALASEIGSGLSEHGVKALASALSGMSHSDLQTLRAKHGIHAAGVSPEDATQVAQAALKPEALAHASLFPQEPKPTKKPAAPATPMDHASLTAHVQRGAAMALHPETSQQDADAYVAAIKKAPDEQLLQVAAGIGLSDRRRTRPDLIKAIGLKLTEARRAQESIQV